MFSTAAFRMYRSLPLVPLDSCLTAAACLSSACFIRFITSQWFGVYYIGYVALEDFNFICCFLRMSWRPPFFCIFFKFFRCEDLLESAHLSLRKFLQEIVAPKSIRGCQRGKRFLSETFVFQTCCARQSPQFYLCRMKKIIKGYFFSIERNCTLSNISYYLDMISEYPHVTSVWNKEMHYIRVMHECT